jgi:hypothetical protein
VISSSQSPLPDNTQYSQQTDIHAPGGIPTHNLSSKPAADPRFRPRVTGTGMRYVYQVSQLLLFSVCITRCKLHCQLCTEISFRSVLRQVHCLCQNEFPIQCDLVLPVSMYSILSFSQGHPVAAYFFFHVFTSLLSCPLFLKRFIVQRVYTVCTRINYKIVRLTNLYNICSMVEMELNNVYISIGIYNSSEELRTKKETLRLAVS